MAEGLLAHLDHSLLVPSAPWSELEAAAALARELEVAALCILPCFVSRAVELLRGSAVVPCTVVAFPHGATSTVAKLRETECALSDGAREIDIVINQCAVRSEQFGALEREFVEVTRLVHAAGARVKWILETAAWDDATIVKLCKQASAAGADWVKTSTGFGPGGATPEHVALLRASCPPEVQVKASGGIRTLPEVERYLQLGASRIGTSQSAALAHALRARELQARELQARG